MQNALSRSSYTNQSYTLDQTVLLTNNLLNSIGQKNFFLKKKPPSQCLIIQIKNLLIDFYKNSLKNGNFIYFGSHHD